MRKIFLLSLISLIVSCNPSQKEENQESDTPQKQENTQEGGITSQDPQMRRLDSLNQAIVENPNSIEALIARGIFHLEAQNLSYAVADAKAVYLLDSNRADVQEFWGDVHYVSNRTRHSKDAWKKCVQLDEKNEDCRLKLAELYNVVEQFKESIKYCNEVIELNPDNAKAYYIKGLNIRDLMGDTAQTLQYLQRAIDLDPDYYAAMDETAIIYAAKKNPLAEDYYKRMIEIAPNKGITYYNLGMYYQSVENWNGALESYTKATQIDPRDAESFFNLGYVYVTLKLNKEALTYFTKAIEARNGINHRAYYGRGFAFEMMGDVNAAERDYRKALEQNPGHGPSAAGLKRIRESAQAIENLQN